MLRNRELNPPDGGTRQTHVWLVSEATEVLPDRQLPSILVSDGVADGNGTHSPL